MVLAWIAAVVIYDLALSYRVLFLGIGIFISQFRIGEICGKISNLFCFAFFLVKRSCCKMAKYFNQPYAY